MSTIDAVNEITEVKDMEITIDGAPLEDYKVDRLESPVVGVETARGMGYTERDILNLQYKDMVRHTKVVQSFRLYFGLTITTVNRLLVCPRKFPDAVEVFIAAQTGLTTKEVRDLPSTELFNRMKDAYMMNYSSTNVSIFKKIDQLRRNISLVDTRLQALYIARRFQRGVQKDRIENEMTIIRMNKLKDEKELSNLILKVKEGPDVW